MAKEPKPRVKRMTPDPRPSEVSPTRETSPQLSLLERLERSGSPAAEAGAIFDLFGSGMGNRIRRTFELVEVVEEALAERWPGREKEPRSAMRLCYPTHPVRLSDMLFRAHVAELFERMGDGRPDCGGYIDPRSGAIWRSLEILTHAEILGLFCEASLRHPLSHHDCLVYETIFRKLFPEVALSETGDSYGETTRAEVERTIGEWLRCESPERASTVREVREEARTAREAAKAAAPSP